MVVPRTFVITGGAGFIGSNLASYLLKMGHSVRIVDNFVTGKWENIRRLESLGGDLTVYENSILDVDVLPSIFERVDTVFHMGALVSVPQSIEDPQSTHEVCVTGTLNVLSTARKTDVRRVVFSSSSAVYGEAENPIVIETNPTAPISPYGAAKLMGEIYCQTFTRAYGLETVVLRYFNVFGDAQDPNSAYAAVIPRFITKMLGNESPVVFGDGNQTRDFVHVDNIVHANMLAADAPEAIGQVFNIASGTRVSLLSLIETLNGLLRTAIHPTFEPERNGDIKHSGTNIDHAHKLLNYDVLTCFDDGLAKTIEWFQTNG